MADKMFNPTKKKGFNPPKFYQENVDLGPLVLERYRSHISLKSFQGWMFFLQIYVLMSENGTDFHAPELIAFI